MISYAIAATAAALAMGTVAPQLIRIEDAPSAMVFGVAIGVANSVVKPVVNMLAIPISCLTFGLFALVVNVGLYYGVGRIAPGMEITWWGAIFGSILTSLAAGLMYAIVDES